MHAACAQWLKHVARQNTKRNKAQHCTVADSSQDKLPLLVLCVCEKKVRARSSFEN